MSLRGQINKISGDVKRAVNQIAKQGIVGLDGAARGTKKIFGYVCAINEDGEMAGTVDVQEFGYEVGDDDIEGVGLHEGVLLSAIQNNENGLLIVPLLYSEVVITQNPTDGTEYVIMYSHAKQIQLCAHEKIEIGVTETEDFVETDEGLERDYYELEPTKNKASTRYTPTSIINQVSSPEDENGLCQEITAKHEVITVGDTTITIKDNSVSIRTNGEVKLSVGNTTITEEGGKVSIDTDTAIINATDSTINSSKCDIKGDNITINGGSVNLTGGTLKTKGASSTDLQGPYNAIKVCPFSGAPHCGSTVSGT